jgi:isopenicillin N synthase-like dioxygenase
VKLARELLGEGRRLRARFAMTLVNVPVIDIGPFRRGGSDDQRRVAASVDEACRQIGFLIIEGHGIAPALIAKTEAVSRQFFDLDLAEKMAVGRPAPDVTRGYIPVLAESVARSRGAAAPGGVPGDVNESMMIGPVDVPQTPYFLGPPAGKHFAPNLWPARPAAFRPVWSEYYRAMAGLAEELMRLFAVALELPDLDFFRDKIDRHISRLRVRNYPAPWTAPEPGQLRAGAHSDYGSLTILKTQDRPGGLQVHNKAGDWVDVPIVDGAFIVNLGDLMARWTNDRWVSTLHRVVNPPPDQVAESRRQSLVFFHNPNYDALIECLPTCCDPAHPPRYRTTTSGEHLRAQFVRTQNAMTTAYAG